ncbi:MAG: hypothetical protein HDT29_03790 [Clostridiales bacterium]|nr:hypothetical protein [Clostridiales bacterium]
MDAQVNDNSQGGVKDIKDKRKSYSKKFSARLYKQFSLLTFLIYYLNLMVRIITRSVSFFNTKGISGFSAWWAYVSHFSNWREIMEMVFDWYTITLVTFLLVYAVVFLFTFIRFSPKNKKTFKHFKKGFLMARRLIKMVSVGLSIAVLINSAQLLTFVDKLLFIFALLTLLFTFIQLCVSITTWIIGIKFKKNNTTLKAYMGKMGNVMSSYVANSRVRSEDSLRSRFLHTVEALTNVEEAKESDRKYSGIDLSENINNTDRFENDYLDPVTDVEQTEKEQSKSVEKRKHISRLKTKTEKVKEPKTKEVKVKEVKVKQVKVKEVKVKEKPQSKKSSVSKRRTAKSPEKKSQEKD